MNGPATGDSWLGGEGQAGVTRQIVKFAALSVGICSLLAGCGAQSDQTVEVFAAASLTGAFEDVARDFEQQHPGTTVRLNFAGSSTLREQLIDGAGGDVFVSANLVVMNQLLAEAEATGLEILGVPVEFASNELVLAVPAGNPGQLSGLDDLGRDDLLIGLCARGVPCGDLARQWLSDERVQASVDTEETDVRSLARRLAIRELDAALVYETDVVADPDLERVSAGRGPRSIYPVVAVSEAGQPFVEFVVSPAGADTLAQWGFDR